MSKCGFEYCKKNGIDPANLFHGIKDSEKDAYKKVGEIEIVKKKRDELIQKIQAKDKEINDNKKQRYLNNNNNEQNINNDLAFNKLQNDLKESG